MRLQRGKGLKKQKRKKTGGKSTWLKPTHLEQKRKFCDRRRNNKLDGAGEGKAGTPAHS